MEAMEPASPPTAGERDPLTTAPRPRWGAILRLALAAVAVLVVLAVLGWWDERRHPERRYLTVPLADVPPGAVVHLDLRRRGIYRFPHGLFLVRDGDRVLALSAASTHLGHQVVWDPDAGEFWAPAHGERWDRLGRKVAGPAPRDLDRFRVQRDGTVLRVDLGGVVRGTDRTDRTLP